MATFPESELEAFRGAVCARAHMERSAFLDNLVDKLLGRYPALEAHEAALADAAAQADAAGEDEEPPEEVSFGDLDGGRDAAVAYAADQIEGAAESPYFALVRKIAEEDDSAAFEELMGTLDRHLKIRGIFFRHRLDPEQEYPGIWGRIWEAIPKWDGRDFRAYVARIVRNYCLDEIHRRKKTPATIDDDPRDVRPRSRSSHLASSHDALAFVRAVLDELEETGRIKAIDAVIFTLICQSLQVADILEAFHGSPALGWLEGAIEALGTKRGRLEAGHVVALRYLRDGLAPEEIAPLSDCSAEQLAAARRALAPRIDEPREPDDLDARLADLLVRPGIGLSDLKRARGLNANAVNLCINRIRLKVWMALVDRAYESLRRRGSVDDVDLQIVRNRCTLPTAAGCRMYKDQSCRRQDDLPEIARRGGLDLGPEAMSERLDDLRRRIVEEGLGMVFPDYNSCLTERKPDRSRRTS